MSAAGEPESDPTASLIWASCRGPGQTDSVQKALSDGADLDRAARTAVRHRVSGFLWRAVQPCAPAGAVWADALSRDAARCRAQATLMFPRFAAEALEPLAAAGLTPLVLKGGALMDRYPAPGLRPMDDVDLLFPPRHRDEAVAVLERSGWRVVKRSTGHYAAAMVHPRLPGLPIDLHDDIHVTAEQEFHLEVAELLKGTRPVTVAGVPAIGLAPEEEILFTATHAAKRFHTFDRLLWTVDIAVIIDAAATAGRSVDWARLTELAEAASARTALAVALNQACRLGAVSPEAVRRLPRARARRAVLAPLLANDWPLIELDDAARNRLSYALVDDSRLRARKIKAELTEGGPAGIPGRVVRFASRAARRWVALSVAPRRHG